MVLSTVQLHSKRQSLPLQIYNLNTYLLHQGEVRIISYKLL